MDKMDDFIKKRLDDQTPAEDAWNIPSDDLWNNAKVHFPKQKKQRRWVWIPILLGLLLSTSIGFYLGKNSLIHKNTTVDIANADQQETIIIEEKKNTPLPSNKVKNKTTQQPTIEAEENIQTRTKKTPIIQTPKIISSTSTIDNEIRDVAATSTQSKTTTTAMPVEQLEIVESEVDAKVNSFVQKEKIIKESTDNPSPKLWSTETITPLLLPIRLEETNEKPLTLAFSNKAITKAKRYHHPNQEFGIGYSESLFRLLDIYGVQNPENGSFAEFDMKYKNINLHYTKWLKRKWSLSTGLYFLEFDLDMNTSIFSKLTNEDIGTYVSQKLDEAAQLRQVVNSSDEFKIKLKEGAQLMVGDSVNIKTKVNMYSRIFQIPVLVNYHIYKNRFEWIFSAGATLDIDYFDQKASDVELYKEGRLITEPAQRPAVLDRSISTTIFGVATMRYHINRKLNFGLSSKVYVTNSLLSNLEAGLYYRF